MPEIISVLDPGAPFSKRLAYHRKRSGKTRAVLGGLVGRSAEWVKGLETGRLDMPRLPMLLRLADILEVDLFDLTGEARLSQAAYTKHSHPSLDTIKRALTAYPAKTTNPVAADVLAGRVQQAWQRWHGQRRERDAIAPLLPGLLADAGAAVRSLQGDERRRAARQLAQIHHLTQLYCAFQPAPRTGLHGQRPGDDHSPGCR